jgi:hypothetical protein
VRSLNAIAIGNIYEINLGHLCLTGTMNLIRIASFFQVIKFWPSYVVHFITLTLSETKEKGLDSWWSLS